MMTCHDLQTRLREKIFFDSETGNLILRSNGRVLGWQQYGYHRIWFDGKKWPAHTIIWIYVHGRFPVGQIDHANGIKNDNRIVNLRECTGSQNGYNKPIHPLNTSGIKGVGFHKASNAWRGRLNVCGISHEFGNFRTKELAAEFVSMAREIMHGEFARDSYHHSVSEAA